MLQEEGTQTSARREGSGVGRELVVGLGPGGGTGAALGLGTGGMEEVGRVGAWSQSSGAEGNCSGQQSPQAQKHQEVINETIYFENPLTINSLSIKYSIITFV